MNAPPAVAALVLADTPGPEPDGPHPALRLHNGSTMLSLAVAAFRAAGIDDVRVVTTHDRPDVIAEGRRCAGSVLISADASGEILPLLCAGIVDLMHKEEEPEDPEAPILAPETALPPAVDAFFAVRAQRALIRPDSIAALYRAWEALPAPARAKAVALPVYAGRCGQLLLIGADHAYPLLQWQGGGQWQDQWQWRGGLLQYAASLLHEPAARRLCEGFVDLPPGSRRAPEPFIASGKKDDVRICFVPLDDPHLVGRQISGETPPA